MFGTVLLLFWLPLFVFCDVKPPEQQSCPPLSVAHRFCNQINTENHVITFDYLTCDQQCWVLANEDIQVNVSCHKSHQIQLKHGVEACDACRQIGTLVTNHLRDTIEQLLTPHALQTLHTKAFLGDRQVFNHNFTRDQG